MLPKAGGVDAASGLLLPPMVVPDPQISRCRATCVLLETAFDAITGSLSSQADSVRKGCQEMSPGDLC